MLHNITTKHLALIWMWCHSQTKHFTYNVLGFTSWDGWLSCHWSQNSSCAAIIDNVYGYDFTQKWSSIITMKTATLITWVWLNYLITNQPKMLKANITDGVPLYACASQLSVLSLGFRQSHYPLTKVHCNHGNLGVKSLISPTLAQPWWKHWSEVTHKQCCMVIVVTSIVTIKNGMCLNHSNTNQGYYCI